MSESGYSPTEEAVKPPFPDFFKPSPPRGEDSDNEVIDLDMLPEAPLSAGKYLQSEDDETIFHLGRLSEAELPSHDRIIDDTIPKPKQPKTYPVPTPQELHAYVPPSPKPLERRAGAGQTPEEPQSIDNTIPIPSGKKTFALPNLEEYNPPPLKPDSNHGTSEGSDKVEQSKTAQPPKTEPGAPPSQEEPESVETELSASLPLFFEIDINPYGGLELANDTSREKQSDAAIPTDINQIPQWYEKRKDILWGNEAFRNEIESLVSDVRDAEQHLQPGEQLVIFCFDVSSEYVQYLDELAANFSDYEIVHKPRLFARPTWITDHPSIELIEKGDRIDAPKVNGQEPSYNYLRLDRYFYVFKVKKPDEKTIIPFKTIEIGGYKKTDDRARTAEYAHLKSITLSPNRDPMLYVKMER